MRNTAITHPTHSKEDLAQIQWDSLATEKAINDKRVKEAEIAQAKIKKSEEWLKKQAEVEDIYKKQKDAITKLQELWTKAAKVVSDFTKDLKKQFVELWQEITNLNKDISELDTKRTTDIATRWVAAQKEWQVN